MIRINLIPVPKVRKQERLIIEAAVAVAVITITIIIGYVVGSGKYGTIEELQSQNRQITEEINKLRAKVGEVEKYKQKLKTLKDQLAVINALQAGRSGPVRMLDELTEVVPRKLFLSNFREQNKKVVVQGLASDGPVIADFLEGLKKGKHFSNVELVNVQAQDQEGLMLQRFTINLDVKYDF